jgi:FkbM family methyltransferase
MEQGHQIEEGVQRKAARHRQIFSAIAFVLTSLVNTLRLATGPGEVASVLRFVLKTLIFHLKGSSKAQADETVRLQRAKHVLGLGTGESFNLLEIYRERVYERLQDFVPQIGWIVFDVGANAGVYTIQQARRGAHVYAFEPNPDCYRRLQKSVRLNNLESRVVTANYALGAAAGSAELLVPGPITMGGSLRPEWSPDPGAIGPTTHGYLKRARVATVEVQTVDRVVQALGIDRVDLLKVDVEGFELEVLQGARETFKRVVRLVLEYHSPDLGRRVAEHVARHGLSVVLDEKIFEEGMWPGPGFGFGLLFAKRQTVSDSGRSTSGIAAA